MALITPVIERLRTQGTQLQQRVYGAAALDRILDEAAEIHAPEAFVILSGETAELATIEQEFSVVLAVDARADGLGDQAQQVVEQLADEVVDALEGWSPTADHRPTRYSSAVLNGFDASKLLWQLLFRTTLERERLVSYQFDVVPVLDVGAVIATVLGNIDTFVSGALPGASRMASDYLAGLEGGLAAGTTGYQIQALAGGARIQDSNVSRELLHCRVLVHRRLGVADAERDYTEGAMQTQIAALLNPSSWRGIAGIHHLEELPELSFPGDVTRL